MWPTYNESGLSARKKSDRASVHEQVRPDRAVHQLAATGSRLLSVKCFYKITITSQFSMGYLLATAFISVNAYFAQSISPEIRFASFSLCGAFHRVVQRRSEADSGAGSRKVVHRCGELEKCLLLRLPLARTLGAAAGGCIGKYVLSLVRPCCRASPLITAFSYSLAEGKGLQTSQIAKKLLRFLKIAFDKEQFFKR